MNVGRNKNHDIMHVCEWEIEEDSDYNYKFC